MSEPHTCHAIGCRVAVPPQRFACPRHWRMLPPEQQRAIWAAYRPGQEQRKDPTAAYLEVADGARHWLHQREGTPVSRLCIVCIENDETDRNAATGASAGL